MQWEPQPLAQLAEPLGFTMADVAFLAGLEESTVSRLWDCADWLDRIKGKSLQSLISVLPGIAEYAVHHSIRSRRRQLLRDLSNVGLQVDENVFRRLVVEDGIPEQYIGNALEAAVHVAKGDVRLSAGHLMRFWGRLQDFALGYLFDEQAGKGILRNPDILIDASVDVADQLTNRASSFHAVVAQANLRHYLARSRGIEVVSPSDRQGVLAYRSAVIGSIIANNSIEAVRSYERTMKDNRVVALVEEWAMPTYSNDARVTQDYSLPRSILLRHTAAEVIRQIREYNDAYLNYLVTVYLPLAIRRDTTFGLQMQVLVAELERRLERCEDPATKKACASFIDYLRRNVVDYPGRRNLADAW